MKISKLFHWLYAVLMLLPVFAIGVTCAYAIFNKNAYKSYAGETLNQSEYKNISVNDMEIGKDYYLILPNSQTYTKQQENTQFNVSNVTLNNELKDINQLRFYVNINSTTLTIQGIGNNSFIIQSNQTHTLKFTFNGSNNNYYDNEINTILYQKTYVQSTYISEVFYYSIDKVQQSPLFNWAYDSFLGAPIVYITGLFGVPNNHISVMLMSYWLAISVIWLVFDMVMYVPLLVHRWIDKGVLE